MSERILCPSFFFLLVKIPMILGKRAHFSGAYGLFFFLLLEVTLDHFSHRLSWSGYSQGCTPP